MQMALFLKNKISRQLELNGSDYTFVQYKTDEYKQLTDEVEKSFVVRGLFHTTNSYIKETASEGARIVSKPQPMMLMLVEDGNKISKDNKVSVGDCVYKVVSKTDVNHFGVVFDVSLELV